ncbi:TrbI/VirB10 family protein [uncultured Fusobacterium sp.]|uniref:TrbI/VirB10 family protein n=1 Tax=uncultured Fusobacterium sp. TaxID=159267 RepID=UPI00265EECEE|nr:TrbI/VirB10 family protein [uncultured Fusobacterium sp.]
MADKKSIFNLPPEDKKTEKINYKNIAIAIGAVIVIVGISFFTFNKKDTKEKTKKINNSQRIEESEEISTTEEIEEMVKSNPIINNQLEAEKADDLELEKIRLQQEYELRRLQMQMEQERLAWENSRKQASLSLIQGQGSYEKEETPKKTNPYDGFSIPPLPEYPKEDPNLQESKKEFAKNSSVDEFVLQRYLQPAVSQYEVKAGTIIPLTLETAINSDLPGEITAVVKTDIYDSKTGNILLIPAGSRVIGRYSSDVSFGQERVQAVINRITLPNQKSINIGTMNLVDKLGASGVSDRIDTKLGKVFTSVIMSAILGVGAGAVKEDNDDSDEWKNDAIDGGGTQAINVGNAYANKVLNVQPSLKIRNGYTVGLFVNKDLLLEPYKD